ncbi:MAG TPA: hypothetical protein VMV05_09775 [bacterium]|nr:hypothetical protein [bacterium]
MAVTAKSTGRRGEIRKISKPLENKPGSKNVKQALRIQTDMAFRLDRTKTTKPMRKEDPKTGFSIPPQTGPYEFFKSHPHKIAEIFESEAEICSRPVEPELKAQRYRKCSPLPWPRDKSAYRNADKARGKRKSDNSPDLNPRSIR